MDALPLLLLALVLAGRGGTLAPPGKGGGPEGRVPYIPTPPAVGRRAMAILASDAALGTILIEQDPAGVWRDVAYRVETHPANASIPQAHRGVSAYRSTERL